MRVCKTAMTHSLFFLILSPYSACFAQSFVISKSTIKKRVGMRAGSIKTIVNFCFEEIHLMKPLGAILPITIYTHMTKSRELAEEV